MSGRLFNMTLFLELVALGSKSFDESTNPNCGPRRYFIQRSAPVPPPRAGDDQRLKAGKPAPNPFVLAEEGLWFDA
ncbi:hypothetical protein C8Q74DRAFT_659549 [Fomes fomentarius]|nr:hypothetical protein C8Q74DRAFT_659549 [Fomes fomentarius]